jgi:hypothetical protein
VSALGRHNRESLAQVRLTSMRIYVVVCVCVYVCLPVCVCHPSAHAAEVMQGCL